MELAPVKGFKNLARDLDTGAILNIDTTAPLGLKLAKEKRQKEKEQLEKNTNDINSIKMDLTEIKTMLKILLTEEKDHG